MDGQSVAWGLGAVLVSVMLMIWALTAKRQRASRSVGRNEQLRRAERAAQELAETSWKARRRSLRGRGAGADSSNEANAGYYGSATPDGP